MIRFVLFSLVLLCAGCATDELAGGSVNIGPLGFGMSFTLRHVKGSPSPTTQPTKLAIGSPPQTAG